MDYVNTNNLKKNIKNFEKSKNLFELEDLNAIHGDLGYPIRRIIDNSTDQFIKTFFSEDGGDEDREWKEYNRGLFLSYVYFSFKLKLETMLNKELLRNDILPLYKNHEDKDNIFQDKEYNSEFVMFLFKGGNIMNMYMKKYFNEDTFDFSSLNDNIKNAFKISDFDFTIYLKCQTDERFKIVLEHLEKVTYEILSSINLFFNSYFKNHQTLTRPLGKNNLANNYLINQNQLNDDLEVKSKINRIDSMLIKLERELSQIYRYHSFEKALVLIGKSKYLVFYLKKEDTELNENEAHEMNMIVDNLYEDEIEKENLSKTLTFQFMHFLILCKQIKNTRDLNNICLDIKKKENELNYFNRCYYIHDRIKNVNNLISNLNRIAKFILFEKIILISKNPINTFLKYFESAFIDHRFYSKAKINKLKENLANGFIETAIKYSGKYFFEKPKKKKLFGLYAINTNEQKKNRIEHNFIGHNLDDISGLDASNVVKLIDLSNSSRDDMVINLGINQNSIYAKYNNNNIHYLTVNNSIFVDRNTADHMISFNLIRSKFNIKLDKVKTKKYSSEPVSNELNVPSEFIDISISTLNDSLYRHFIMHPDNFTNELNVTFDGIENNHLKSYNIEYIVSDLHYILFKQKNYIPWLDNKYGKRVKRLGIMYLLEAEDSKYLDDDDYNNHKTQIIRELETITNQILTNQQNPERTEDIINELHILEKEKVVKTKELAKIQSQKNSINSNKIDSKIKKLFSILDLLELIQSHISGNLNEGNYDISENSPLKSFINFSTDEFKNILENINELDENFTNQRFANYKFSDNTIPKLIECICFNTHLFCFAKKDEESKELSQNYINKLNKHFLYLPFDDFKTDYLDKIYNIEKVEEYGGGLIKEIRESIICTLSAFYNIPKYKRKMNDIYDDTNYVTNENHNFTGGSALQNFLEQQCRSIN